MAAREQTEDKRPPGNPTSDTRTPDHGRSQDPIKDQSHHNGPAWYWLFMTGESEYDIIHGEWLTLNISNDKK